MKCCCISDISPRKTLKHCHALASSLIGLHVQFPARGVGEVNGVSVRVVPLHSSNKNLA